MKLSETAHKILDWMIPTIPKPNRSRREFMEKVGGATVAAAALAPTLEKISLEPKQKRDAETDTGIIFFGEFGYVKDPLAVIDRVVESIQNKSGLQTNSEHSFLSAFLTDQENRVVLQEAYRQIAEPLIGMLRSADQANVLNFFPMAHRLWDPFRQMMDLTDPANASTDFMTDGILNDLQKLVIWLRPLHESVDYFEQKRAYLPNESQAKRIVDSQFWTTYFPAMRDARAPRHDAEWNIRDALRTPQTDVTALLNAQPEYDLRLPSQLDIEVNLASLTTIEEYLPLALIPVTASSPGNLESTLGIRANHAYGSEISTLGEQNKYIADRLREKRYGTSTAPDADLRLEADQGLQIDLHETAGHTYDPHNPNARNFSHLHPQDEIEYCMAYVQFYAQLNQYFDLPSKTYLGLVDKDLDAVFVSKTLPIFGTDEIKYSDASNLDGLNADFDQIHVISSFIFDQHFSKEIFEKIGLSEFFNPSRTDALPMWQILAQTNISFYDNVDPDIFARLKRATGFDPLGSAKMLSPSHLDQLSLTFNLVMSEAQKATTQNKQPGDFGADGITGDERRVLLDAILRIKSQYQLIFFTVLHRLHQIVTDDQLKTGEIAWTPEAETAYQGIKSTVYLQLAHCLTGPYGEYAPAIFSGDTSLSQPPDASLPKATQSATENFSVQASNYQSVVGVVLPTDKQAGLRDVVWGSQVNLQRNRPKLLGADVSQAASRDRKKSLQWMDTGEYLAIYPEMLEDFLQKLGLH